MGCLADRQYSAFANRNRGLRLGVVFTRANSKHRYCRLSQIVKIAENAIFDSEKGNVQGSCSAFVPAPVPPELDWTPRLIGAQSDAGEIGG
jgi:hypothetical protein